MRHILQIAWSNFRDDGEWRDYWGRYYSNAVVLRGPLVKANKHISDGHYDAILHSSSEPFVFPSMGRYVLWPFIRSRFT